jgi:hypothetical protein
MAVYDITVSIDETIGLFNTDWLALSTGIALPRVGPAGAAAVVRPPQAGEGALPRQAVRQGQMHSVQVLTASTTMKAQIHSVSELTTS